MTLRSWVSGSIKIVGPAEALCHSVYMHVSAYTYSHICTYLYIYTHTHTYFKYILVYTVCIHICMYIYIYIYTHIDCTGVMLQKPQRVPEALTIELFSRE